MVLDGSSPLTLNEYNPCLCETFLVACCFLLSWCICVSYDSSTKSKLIIVVKLSRRGRKQTDWSFKSPTLPF